jgi:hypothetical protein
MKWEWSIGEVILIAFALYELWSLRKYKDQDAKVEPTERPKTPDA